MHDATELRCPNCGSTDLVSIHLASIDDELLECQSCKRLCKVMYRPDGSVAYEILKEEINYIGRGTEENREPQ
jgi:hypothetical protein